MPTIKSLVSLSVLFAACCFAVGCGPSENTVSAPPESPPTQEEMEEQRKAYEAEQAELRKRDRDSSR